MRHLQQEDIIREENSFRKEKTMKTWKYEIPVSEILQSVLQIKNHYKNSWGKLFGTHGTTSCPAATPCQYTPEQIYKLLGQGTQKETGGNTNV